MPSPAAIKRLAVAVVFSGLRVGVVSPLALGILDDVALCGSDEAEGEERAAPEVVFDRRGYRSLDSRSEYE